MSIAVTNARRRERVALPGWSWLRASTSRVPDWLGQDVLLPFAATRAALLAIGWIADAAITPSDNFKPSENSWVINSLARWDSEWYLSIAQNGYGVSPSGFPTYVFSPLLPALMRGLGVLLHQQTADRLLLIGIVVANLAAIGAIAYLVALVRLDFAPDVASRTALYVLAFPATLFLSAVYTESQFLLFAVSAIYYARKRRWWLVGILGALAALSRPQGVIVVVPLLWEYVAQRRARGEAPVRLSIGWLTLIPAAYAGLAAYMYRLTGSPFIMVTAESGDAWGRHLGLPFAAALRELWPPQFLQHVAPHPQIDALSIAVFLVLVIACWRLLRPSYALMATVLYLPIILSDTLQSPIRYCLVIFPAFIVLALAGRNRTFDRVYLAGSGVVAGLCMALFASGYWVA